LPAIRKYEDHESAIQVEYWVIVCAEVVEIFMVAEKRSDLQLE
jgi:hypothetical protein